MTVIYATETVLPRLIAYATERGVTVAEAAHSILKKGLGAERWFGLQQRDERGEWRTVRRYEFHGEALEARGSGDRYRVVDVRSGEILDWKGYPDRVFSFAPAAG